MMHYSGNVVCTMSLMCMYLYVDYALPFFVCLFLKI